MFNISNYLKKISSRIDSEEEIKNSVVCLINKETGSNIDPKETEIKNYVFYTKASGATQNKVFIKKQKILKEINKLFPKKVVDIK